MSAATDHGVYRRAARHLATGDFALAIEELTSAVRKQPDAGRLWELRGQAHLADGDPIDAVNCLEHAQCLVPLSIEGRLALANAYEVTDRRGSAGDLYSALAEEPSLPTTILEPLAKALGRVEELEHALTVCFEAARRSPDRTAPLLGIVFYQRRLGFRCERILPVLFRAFHLDPDDFDIRMALARMLQECGQTRDAAELLSVVDIETSCCPTCLAAMQHIFEEAGDQERVGRCLDTLITLSNT